MLRQFVARHCVTFRDSSQFPRLVACNDVKDFIMASSLKTNIKNKFLTSSILSTLLLISSMQARALGECGLSCCLAGANSSGVTLAENFGFAVQYEHSDMQTILNGTTEVSPDAVLDANWVPGSMYSVPTKMTMEKLSFIGARPLNERWTMMGIVPLLRNNMDMRMRNGAGMTMDMSMEEIAGLGDISLLAFYTAYTDAPVRPTERLTLGIGIKTPTGKNDELTASGNYVHAMMQLGSGSWDGLFTLNYMRAFYPLVTQVNAFYHLTTEGDEGYEFGDQAGIDLVMRYQTTNYVNLGIELNMIKTQQDTDHDGKYSRPLVSMVDNTAYTGLTSVLLTPGVQFRIPETTGSIEVKYQTPVYQKVNGYQQVLDARWLVTGSVSF